MVISLFFLSFAGCDLTGVQSGGLGSEVTMCAINCKYISGNKASWGKKGA